MAVYRGSRYVKTGAYLSGENTTLTLKLRERPKFNLSRATTYTWVQGDTIDAVATRLYGSAVLYWAIMDANPRYQSEMEIEPGHVLLVPEYREVVRLSG